jgi:Rrf2 family protein
MKISAATSYALQSLILLARWNRCIPISANRLARGDIPRRFLPQVLHKLVEHGVLISTAGVAGGYCLARSPQSITLLEIIEAIEGTFSISMSRVPRLSKDAQNELRLNLSDTSEHVRQRFRIITLAQLASAAPSENDELGSERDTRSAAENYNQITTIQLECPE